MKLTRKEIKKIIKEEIEKVSPLAEGMMKRIYGEFENFVMEHELSREDVEGMLDILFPPKEESGPKFQNAGEQSADDRAMQSGDWYGDRDK